MKWILILHVWCRAYLWGYPARLLQCDLYKLFERLLLANQTHLLTKVCHFLCGALKTSMESDGVFLLYVRESKKPDFWIKLWPVIELLLLLTVRRLFNSFDLLEKCQKGPREEDTRLSVARNTHRTGCTAWYLLFECEPNINANDILAGRENSLCISLLISMFCCLKKKTENPERQSSPTFSVRTKLMRCRHEDNLWRYQDPQPEGRQWQK